jgi:hypothetical protein
VYITRRRRGDTTFLSGQASAAPVALGCPVRSPPVSANDRAAYWRKPMNAAARRRASSEMMASGNVGDDLSAVIS